ncbi:MAG: MutS-related protein [Longimicrobiales bacterium]
MTGAAAAGPASIYAQRAEHFAARSRSLARRTDRLANLRLALFIIGIGALFIAEQSLAYRGAALLLALGAAAAFSAVVIWHQRTRRQRVWHDAQAQLARDGMRRIARAWSDLETPALPGVATSPEHAYAADLDVLGEASLTRLLGPAATATGAQRAATWLLGPASRAGIVARQQAARELAPRIELRHALVVGGRLAGRTRAHELATFLDWLRRPPWLRPRRFTLWAARLVPLATMALLVLDITGAVDTRLWLGGPALALWLSSRHGARLRGTLRDVATSETLRRHAALLRLIETAELEAPLLRQLQDRLRATPRSRSAAAELARLGALLNAADLRLSLIHFIVHLLTFWDFHVVWGLERWKQRTGAMVHEWVDALAEFDALAAIATLHFDEPTWAFPQVVDTPPAHLDAAALAHPLLRADTRVANDVRLGPPGGFLLITGSNMSGKSTLLRAIGTNVVLAQAGAPVCAASMRLALVRPHTGMRVADSLQQGLSLFMAEVRRLARIVEAARDRGAPPVLYLLDEILQGTNVEDHRTGAAWILRHLLETNAIGAVATHDLQLAEAPELRAAAVPVHLREFVGETDQGATMRFDYRVRPGIAPTRNALHILRLAGLAHDE